MSRPESLAERSFKSVGFTNVLYEPDGNAPPDFLLDGEIAVEGTDLTPPFHHETIPARCNPARSTLVSDGRYSHAVIKRPARGDYRVQSQHGGSVEAAEPTPAMIDSAQRVLSATAALGYPDIAYARVDGVMVDGRFRLMELEVIEPALFLAGRPDAAERFAANLQDRLAAIR